MTSLVHKNFMKLYKNFINFKLVENNITLVEHQSYHVPV